MIESIKITGLNDIGAANLTPNAVFPLVNMTGTPFTDKANLQIIGNYFLSQAGSANFVQAAQATLAQSVVNSAQPNITSVGTLTSLALSGNLSIDVYNLQVSGGSNGQFLRTDGTGNLSWASGAGGNSTPGGSNTQVQFNNSGEFGGSSNLTWDSSLNVLTSNAINTSNIIHSESGQIGVTPGSSPEGVGPTWTFDSSGGLYWPASGGALWVIQPNEFGEFDFRSTSNIVISTDISNAAQHFTFDTDGIFWAPSNVNLLGSRLNVGPDAAAITTLLNPTLIIANTGAQYIQAAIINNDANGSSDWSADGAGGGDDQAWTDIGFAGYAFNDPAYTITEPGDGYLFVQGYASGTGGNLVLSTGELGDYNDIVFSTNGFLAENEFARIEHSNNVLHLTRAGSGIKFSDDTTQTTAAIVWTSAPVSNTSAGDPGQAAYDAGGNLFVCVSANTWAKFAGTLSW